MKNISAIIIFVLFGLFVFGCSKKQPEQIIVSQPKITDLGVVELSDHSSCTNDLGNGKDCIIRFDSTSQKTVDVHLVIEEKDANGEMKQIAMPRIGAIIGNQVSASVGEIGVSLVAKLKSN